LATKKKENLGVPGYLLLKLEPIFDFVNIFIIAHVLYTENSV
jgi:hypothetical protein